MGGVPPGGGGDRLSPGGTGKRRGKGRDRSGTGRGRDVTGQDGTGWEKHKFVQAGEGQIGQDRTDSAFVPIG